MSYTLYGKINFIGVLSQNPNYDEFLLYTKNTYDDGHIWIFLPRMIEDKIATKLENIRF